MSLSTSDLLLLKAVDGGRIVRRVSRGYDLDRRPTGWGVFCLDGRPVDTQADNQLDGLYHDGLVDWAGDGEPVKPTADGLLALLKGQLQ